MTIRGYLKILLFSGALLVTMQESIAQAPKGFNELKNTTSLQSTLAATSKTTQTISSDFTQVKHMKMLNDKVVSKGKFYFKKEDKIRIEYNTPFQYLLVMNRGQIMVKDGGKTSKINTRNSRTMQSVNKIMMDCMQGTVLDNKDFSVKAYESKEQVLLTLTPVANGMKNLFSRIDVYIARKDNNVDKLIMHEEGGDYTDMNFSNKKLNASLSDALFSVR